MERNQSARECRARKKLRYDYLDDLVLDREKTVKRLQTELRTVGTDRLPQGVVYSNSTQWNWNLTLTDSSSSSNTMELDST
jgi:hypothetical protein